MGLSTGTARDERAPRGFRRHLVAEGPAPSADGRRPEPGSLVASVRRAWTFEANALDSFIRQRFAEGSGVPGSEGHPRPEGAEGACGQDAGTRRRVAPVRSCPWGSVLRGVDVQPTPRLSGTRTYRLQVTASSCQGLRVKHESGRFRSTFCFSSGAGLGAERTCCRHADTDRGCPAVCRGNDSRFPQRRR